jgi:hypothetical protein
MNRFSGVGNATFLATAISVAMLGLLWGCTGVETAKSIREAQAQFSRAAQIEDRSLLGAERGVQASTEAATNYRMAATSLQKLIADKGGDLKKDNLLCTAMAIEALSWWRLGVYDTALQIANNSSSCSDSATPSGSQPSRDLVLFQALPGLIRIDQAHQKLAKPAGSIAQFNEVMTLLNDANNILQTARGQIDPGHPLQLYLIQSQLAIVRNWQYAIFQERLTGTFNLCETGEASLQSVKLLAELACASLAVPGQQGKQDIVNLIEYWKFITGGGTDNPPPVLSSPPSSITRQNCTDLDLRGGFPDSCQRP